MAYYVDGFVIPLPKNKLDVYRRIAQKAGEVWRDHGALEYLNSIANGADGLLFFRWRSLPYGSEAHWNGLLYHDERNAWRLNEAKQLGGEIKRLSSMLTDTRCASQAA